MDKQPIHDIHMFIVANKKRRKEVEEKRSTTTPILQIQMATILSPSAIFSSSSPTPPRTQTNSPPSKSQIALLPPTTTSINNNNRNRNSNKSPLASASAAAAAAAAAVILSTTPIPPPSLADPSTSFSIYYGTAASAANYGGYGGNSSKKESAEYVYDVPEGWKERPVSKVEKGTNGTDSGFYNPKKKSEKEYLTFLAGFRQLAPMDVVLNNLALSDVDLQDLISSADSVNSQEKKDENGQVYYVYEIEGAGAHSLISVTCANNKLYAHFVNAPNPEWNKDQDTLKHLHESFKTVGSF